VALGYGIEVLLEQGYRQFELWTGRRCPKERGVQTVLAAYHALRSVEPLVLARVELDAVLQYRTKKKSELRVEVERRVFVLDIW